MTRDEFSKRVLESEQTLYRISMSMLKNETDCEDAVQTAILTAYEKLSTLKEEQYFRTWLVRILINICNTQLKKRNKIISLEDAKNMPEPFVPSHTDSTELRLAIEELPVKIRQAVVLYYIEDFSVSEIKNILKIPEGTVKSRLSKGRSHLRRILG